MYLTWKGTFVHLKTETLAPGHHGWTKALEGPVQMATVGAHAPPSLSSVELRLNLRLQCRIHLLLFTFSEPQFLYHTMGK